MSRLGPTSFSASQLLVLWSRASDQAEPQHREPRHQRDYSRSFSKPIERIESLRRALRFRMLLGSDVDKLEVVR